VRQYILLNNCRSPICSLQFAVCMSHFAVCRSQFAARTSQFACSLQVALCISQVAIASCRLQYMLQAACCRSVIGAGVNVAIGAEGVDAVGTASRHQQPHVDSI
jgi:hypothetical protein